MMRGKEEGSKMSAAPTRIAGAAMPLADQPLINVDTQCRERPGFMPEATVYVRVRESCRCFKVTQLIQQGKALLWTAVWE